MSKFLYEGTDEAGKPTSGFVEADSINHARAVLEQKRIRVTSVVADDYSPDLDNLRPGEAREVASQVSSLVAGGLPLSEGLRAAAAELETPGLNPLRIVWSWFTGRSEARIRAALLRIAGRVEAGDSINHIVSAKRLPPELKAVLQSGIPSDRAAMAIGEYSVYAGMTSRLRGHVMFQFAYPLLALSTACSLVGAYFYYLVPSVKKVFSDFATELPWLTQLVFGISDMTQQLGWVIVVPGPFIVAIMIAVFFTAGAAWSRSLQRFIPILGSAFRSLELAKITHVLAVVLRHDASVPAALRAAGTAADDTSVKHACDELALTVESGKPIPSSIEGLRGVPLGFVQVAQDGSDRDTAADALHSIANIFEQRSRVVMGLLAAIVQPIVVIGVCGLIGLCFLSLFLPLIKLLNDLA